VKSRSTPSETRKEDGNSELRWQETERHAYQENRKLQL
jgi:hypothetical protein